MSLHIAATPEEVAKTVLIAGDPLRARYIAEKMMTEVQCYNEIRGMLGFTGLYKGKRVSVQGTGIGIPSTAIYLHELILDYNVEKIIRIGTCGSLQPDLPLDQLILATAAYTDSHTHLLYHADMQSPTTVQSAFLQRAREVAQQQAIAVIEGPVFSTDMFYNEDKHHWDGWRDRGILAIEMETSILYAMARKYNIQALSILSVSDNIITHASQAAAYRQEASDQMMVLGMELA